MPNGGHLAQQNTGQSSISGGVGEGEGEGGGEGDGGVGDDVAEMDNTLRVEHLGSSSSSGSVPVAIGVKSGE
ncbi:hypothetical protein CFAM422_012798 [Trichoderma lentiforme]|uniref:Uncharacterized protein n=1 Tax=Trichoderma lentiforme TaxID=1567552 RepID=A0A9P4X3B3_9HYPO|nr:hypothetical protein CFAM422_012798 [Trichoderma lentiforme]